jgi:hypothetical protein
MKVAGKTIDVALHDATVLEVDKYSRKGMFTANSPLRTYIRHTHVIFQLKDTNKTFSLDAKNVELPVHSKQKVGIISLNRSVIGFSNTDSDEYYYITNDFYKVLSLGRAYFLVWLTGIAGAIFILSALKTNYASLLSLVPFAFAWLVYSIKKFFVNKEIETAVDKFMQDK